MYAPIVVFGYKRKDHIERVVEALAENKESKDSDIWFYLDGSKNESDIDQVNEVRKYIRSINKNWFHSISIICAENNQGLAKSVISGVDNVIEKYGKVIVVEDDALVSPFFLNFMNTALEYYYKDNQIFSVGGYVPNMSTIGRYDKDIVITQRSSSCAWGTWRDRWERIDWSISNYNKFRFDFIKRKMFNEWGNDRSSMLDDQMKGRISSWAIRFDYAMFSLSMMNIVPYKSLVTNIGNDGSGTHVSSSSNSMFFEELEVYDTHSIKFEHVEVDQRIKTHYQKLFKVKRVNLLKRYISNLFYKT